jgi:2-C-methyl-D-erythritol 2,4-cyclodiphosphate synthase
MDALLGALALGDIGQYFPDSDPRFKDADSLALLKDVCADVQKNGYALENADITIIAEKPKLAAYIPAMREKIADAMGVETSAVSVKATTEEKMGFTGAGIGIAAHAVVLLKNI